MACTTCSTTSYVHYYRVAQYYVAYTSESDSDSRDYRAYYYDGYIHDKNASETETAQTFIHNEPSTSKRSTDIA